MKFFNKDFYEMLANIKAYQSETVSQHSPLCCKQAICLQKDHFRF